jgi:mRNA interferase MazF
MRRTRLGKMHNFGEVVLTSVQYADTFEMKKRPAVILFEENGNVVVLGITSNLKMKGVSLSKKEGAIKDSIIKLNYIFTVSNKMIEKNLFMISGEKRDIIKKELVDKIR